MHLALTCTDVGTTPHAGGVSKTPSMQSVLSSHFALSVSSVIHIHSRPRTLSTGRRLALQVTELIRTVEHACIRRRWLKHDSGAQRAQEKVTRYHACFRSLAGCQVPVSGYKGKVFPFRLYIQCTCERQVISRKFGCDLQCPTRLSVSLILPPGQLQEKKRKTHPAQK